MKLTKEEQKLYDGWSKKQVYIAYLGEHQARKNIEAQFNKAMQRDAMLRYDRDMFKEKYLRLHIEKNVAVTGDKEGAIEAYFENMHREVYFTRSGGYYCTINMEDCIWLAFVWANPKEAKAEYKDMPELLRSIANTTMQPVRWNGVTNVLSNHSVDLGDGVFELRL